MNRKFVSKSNYVLRKVLNKEENLDILKDMIESILQIKIKKIELNPYLEKKKQNLPAEENFGIADVRLEKADGEELNVGIQFVDGYHVITKMLIYYAQIHANQLEYDKDRKVAKTVTINFVDFDFLKQPNYHQKISMAGKENPEALVNNIEMHVIELGKFKETLDVFINKEKAWVSYFRGKKVEEICANYPIIKKLDEKLMEYWNNEVME